MAYGDSANWDGIIPAASVAKYMIEWKTIFGGGVGGQPPTCVFEMNSNYTIEQVAEKLAEAWNDQNSSARRAIYKNGPNCARRVQFDGEVVEMQVRGYLKPAPGIFPPNEAVLPFQVVEYGIKTQVLPEPPAVGRLFVFNA